MDGKKKIPGLGAALLILLCLSGAGCGRAENAVTITNVSYDPTREFYEAYNEMFQQYYLKEKNLDVHIVQSNGGSGAQARSVMEGAVADVVTLALEHDIKMLQQDGMIDENWITEFEGDSAPYTSTIVFLVRKGNEKGIRDWDDLIEEGVDIITPDPKSSGGACWNFLVAWYYAQRQYNGNEAEMRAFVRDLYNNVLVMDSGARGATTTFVENGQGDLLIAWENEEITSINEYPDSYEIVTPSVSILAQPSVAVVDENVNKTGTQEIASDYLAYLYSDEAQRLCAEYGYRPSNPDILQEYGTKFDLNVDLCTIADFGGWDKVYEDFFSSGAVFDQIYQY